MCNICWWLDSIAKHPSPIGNNNASIPHRGIQVSSKMKRAITSQCGFHFWYNLCPLSLHQHCCLTDSSHRIVPTKLQKSWNAKSMFYLAYMFWDSSTCWANNRTVLKKITNFVNFCYVFQDSNQTAMAIKSRWWKIPAGNLEKSKNC